jgi:flagellar assembly factor FliW
MIAESTSDGHLEAPSSPLTPAEGPEHPGDEDLIFSFPNGILGFPSSTEFTLAAAEIPGFYWMQASNPGTLAFLLVDPFRLLDDFSVDLPDTELVHLETNHAPDVGVMAIVTLPASSNATPTANLQGIVAFNFSKRIGRQVIIQDSPYGTRWPLDLERLRLAS